MAPQTLPTVRVFAPELWGEVDRFANFYGETYKFSDRDRRAVSGVATHLEKAITLRALAVKLRPGLDIDRDQLNKNGFTPAVNSRELSSSTARSIPSNPLSPAIIESSCSRVSSANPESFA